MKAIFPILATLLPAPLLALDYERDIMPIFMEKCADCHSNEAGQSKGGFKVDDPDHLLGRLDKNGLVTPGDWDGSYLFVTLFRPPESDDAMPPSGKGERLTPAETRKVQQWIADGAKIGSEKGESGPMPKKGELGYIEVEGEVEETSSLSGMPEQNTPRSWTNQEGKTIFATLLKVDGDAAVLKMENGKVYHYPIANLSAESQAALKE
ncbi:MAG: c-type cytochrome domain-containing protein [Verrucomicrobiota bacterium]